jgi:hypothetical protein
MFGTVCAVGAKQSGLDEISDDTKGEVPSQDAAAGPQDIQSQASGPVGTVVQQQRFPNSTRAFNQNRSAVATSRRE